MSDVRKLKLEELGRVDIDTYKQLKKIPVVILLDNLRSGLNVGSFFRTTDCFGLKELCLCGITPKPPHKEILKSAIGASLSVDWTYEKEVQEAIHRYKQKGHHIIGVEQTTQSVDITSFNVAMDQKYVLVFGNEVEGISESILNEIDSFIDIAQYGTKHSLNVSVCGGIVAHYFSNAQRGCY